MESDATLKFEYLQEEVHQLKDAQEIIRKDIDNRVTFAIFTWVLGILMIIITGILGLIYVKVEKIEEKIGDTRSSVARIEGRLSNAQISE